jgi:hypothetical protein
VEAAKGESQWVGIVGAWQEWRAPDSRWLAPAGGHGSAPSTAADLGKAPRYVGPVKEGHR